MPQPYNLTNLSNSQNLVQVFTAANQFTDGLFVTMLLFTMWVVVFVALSFFQTKQAFFSASTLTFIIAIIAFTQGWISQTVLMMMITLEAVAVVWLWATG